MVGRKRKVLVIRFSSFGDILQCFPVAQQLKAAGFDEVHWLTREDFVEVVRTNPAIDKTIGFARSQGLYALIRLALQLRTESYDLIYDAHNNLRSHIFSIILRLGTRLVRRKKFRLHRYLLFRWHWNLFGKKVVGQQTYLEPLGASASQYPISVLQKENYVALVPGAAWPLKVWPLEHWLALIDQFPNENFVVLGGSNDHICFEIQKQLPHVEVLAGQLSLLESMQYIAKAKAVVANDTGLLHAADLYQVPAVALIGPSAFGYPAAKTSVVQEVELWCKPCSKDGRGKCRNSIYKKCMYDISPKKVATALNQTLNQALS